MRFTSASNSRINWLVAFFAVDGWPNGPNHFACIDVTPEWTRAEAHTALQLPGQMFAGRAVMWLSTDYQHTDKQ
jgi:hypothetical protein